LAKHLTPTDIQAIVDIIRNWSTGKLTWNGICDAAAPVIGSKTTRQTFVTHKPITEAYNAKKSGVKVHQPRTSMPGSLTMAAQRIARLQNENDELKATNAALLEQFVRWQYIAYKYGLKEHQLSEELPRIDRERTDGKTK